MNIITGEKIQQLCNVYLGFQDDFHFNPNIQNQKEKQLDLNNLNSEFNNPYLVFCYSHRLSDLSNKIHLFKNKFILISHNSDGEIRNNDFVLTILNYNKLNKWYAQNICFYHEKLFFLPIGLANSQWNHGNLGLFLNTEFIQKIGLNKNKKVYFNFCITTNREKRQICFDSLKNKIEWLDNIDSYKNLQRLHEYQFCICPEGNGCDTHRIWEALYLKTVPIVIKSNFTKILQKNNIPILILENWNDFDINKLDYYSFDLSNIKIKMDEFILTITNS